MKNLEDTDPFCHQQVWVVPSQPGIHPAFREQASIEASNRNIMTRPVMNHKRTSSHQHSPVFASQPATTSGKPKHGVTKSLSDTDFFRMHRTPSGIVGVSRDGSLERKPKMSINTTLEAPKRQKLGAIDEMEVYVKSYKVAVRESQDDTTQVIRSPLKKLFGDGGILGRSLSTKDLPDPRYKKTGFAHWGGRVRQRVEEIVSIATLYAARFFANIRLKGKEISEKLPSVELNGRGAGERSAGSSTFPVTLSPYVQGVFYMQLELLLNIETNRFIMNQLQYGRVSVESVRRTVQIWQNKGRPQVTNFRYDCATQRDLVLQNIDAMHFVGVNALSKMKLHSVLASWKVLAKEMSIRTFCQPDSVVKKHVHDAEKVLELIDADTDSMLAFQEMRARIISEIYHQEKWDRERDTFNGISRPWSPAKQM